MITGAIVSAIVAVVFVAALTEAFLKRNRRKPLSSGRPSRPPKDVGTELGMEATDTKLVDAAHRENEYIQRLHSRLSKRHKKRRWLDNR